MSQATPKFVHRLLDCVGLACLVACLLLMSTGVRIVHADEAAVMSTDPARTAALSAKPEVSPPAPVHVTDVENVRRPGVPAIEIEPGVVVLNTRGFNYGPPPTELDPAALRVEGEGQ